MAAQGRGSASRSGLTDPYRIRACDGCSDLVDLVWWGGGLPIVTILSIWLYTFRGTPLPIITDADRRLTIEPGVYDTVAGWAG